MVPATTHVWESGAGPFSVLCIHETGATSEVWRPVAEALEASARVIAYDRPGWGRSSAPDTYLRTTIGEQATVAAGVLTERERSPALVCGAGLGAVVALELLLRHGDRASAALLVEPPLLAFVPEATDALSESAAQVRDAVADGGRREALARYLDGRLGALSAGAERIPQPARSGTRGSAEASFFAELAAVPAWELPLPALAAARGPSLIVCGSQTPALVRRAAEGLASVLARSQRREVGPGLPHHDQAQDLAALVVELAESL